MRSLRIFIAAYEERSFTLAAQREGATQSGVSQHIRNLEDRHGVLLFRRDKGRVVPTPAAETFYIHSLAALRASDTAFTRLRQFSVGLSGDTSVGLMPTLSAASLAPALLLFRERHPNARVHVTEGYSAALTERVIAGDLDFAIVPAMPEVPGIRLSAFLATREMLVRRGPGEDMSRAPVALSALGAIKLILPERANVRANAIQSFMTGRNVEISETIEMNSMMATLDLVAQSDWCAVLPELMMATSVYGAAFDVREMDPPMTLQLVCAEPAQRARSPIAEAFLGVLRESSGRLIDQRHPSD